ncbi:carbohydrate ABC transporter permease [uncultured Alsobacter sp.]|uniref:carbohydrate ABC transporter permease n=1 Tax=uncultured Alsobacter sp. TaxID=1748258 RepID=UPI0025F8A253|nr:carbohydrate ABC transporter permease [uncultured Alsobacter sp.]
MAEMPNAPVYYGSRAGRVADAALFYGCLAALLLFFLFPLAWMVLTSLKTNVQAMAYPPLWVFAPTIKNYIDVFANNPFFQYMVNSTIVAVSAVGVSLLLGLPAAYSMARYRQTKLGLTILVVKILPGIVYLVPLFVIYRQLGLINTLWGVALAHIIVVLPLVIWIMVGFFEDIPRELEEAALIDGCTRAGIFLRIVLPLSKPGIVAATILGFIASWNNFIFALILGGKNTVTLPMAVYSFVSFEDVNWGGLTAAATVITLPILALSLVVQKHLAGGLTIGAVKG